MLTGIIFAIMVGLSWIVTGAAVGLAEKHGFVTVDGAQLILHDPAFYQDAEILHPNDLGFDLYAQNLLRMI